MTPPLKKMLRIVVLLNENYSKDTDAGEISNDCIAKFLDEYEFDSFGDLSLDIGNTQVKNARWENRKDFKLNKVLTFVYSTIMDFPVNKFEIKTVATKHFFNNFRDLIYGGYVTHHSHVTGEAIGYAQDFCHKNIRENHNLIPVFIHNLFSFYFFFVVEGIKLCVWTTKQLNIGRTNIANVQHHNIGIQVKFIDTIKYYQQSLSSLVENASEFEKENIRILLLKFKQNSEIYLRPFSSLAHDEKNWVLDYLCGGKGVFPYEKIKSQEDIDAVLRGVFFFKNGILPLAKK